MRTAFDMRSFWKKYGAAGTPASAAAINPREEMRHIAYARMEEEMHLTTKITREGHDHPLKGECSRDTLKKMSLLRLLGFEFMSHAKRPELLEVCKEAFVLFANARNDKAAKQALEAVYELVVTTYRSAPIHMDLSVEAFHAKRREEEKEFFDWLETTFWAILFYLPDTVECRTSGNAYFSISQELKQTRSAMMSYAAKIWSDGSDELAFRAFEFLCDCCDSYRFSRKAETTTTAFEDFRKRYGSYYGSVSFSIPKDDVEMVLAHMRSAMPRTLKDIRVWGKRAQRGVPKSIREILGHAYVNAGGDVFLT